MWSAGWRVGGAAVRRELWTAGCWFIRWRPTWSYRHSGPVPVAGCEPASPTGSGVRRIHASGSRQGSPRRAPERHLSAEPVRTGSCPGRPLRARDPARAALPGICPCGSAGSGPPSHRGAFLPPLHGRVCLLRRAEGWMGRSTWAGERERASPRHPPCRDQRAAPSMASSAGPRFLSAPRLLSTPPPPRHTPPPQRTRAAPARPSGPGHPGRPGAPEAPRHTDPLPSSACGAWGTRRSTSVGPALPGPLRPDPSADHLRSPGHRPLGARPDQRPISPATAPGPVRCRPPRWRTSLRRRRP